MAGSDGPEDAELVTQDDVRSLEVALAVPDFIATGPLCWGPNQWLALHQMLRGYPRTDPSPAKQRALRQYVAAMADVMPCSICSDHWRKLAPTVKTGSRLEALKWSIDAHNTVNKRLGKPVYTYAQAVKLLKEQCPGNKNLCQQLQAVATANAAKTRKAAATWRVVAIVFIVVAAVALVALIVVATLKFGCVPAPSSHTATRKVTT